MEVTLSGIITVSKDLHPRKELYSIVSTESGIVILTSDEFANMPFGKVFKVFGSLMDFNGV